MKSAHFLCWFVILGNIMLAAQSNTAAIIDPTVPSKASRGLSKPDPKTQGRILETYGKLPLSFEENRGQTDAQVKFVSRGSGYTLFLTGDEAVLSLRGSTENGEASPGSRKLQPTAVPTTNAVLRMKLYHANPSAKVTGAEELSGKSNYFIGNDAKKWHTNVPMYAKVTYKSIYSGIDLVYYGNQRQLEYDFVVAPGADPRHIQFDLSGARKISQSEDGDLVAQIGDESEVRWHKPVIYQQNNGVRREITGHYVIKRGRRLGFEVGTYDSKRPLIIDPALGYSTYLGGSRGDGAISVAVDASGNAYISGGTGSPDFPTTPGAYQTTCSSCNNNNVVAFASKLNPTGSGLVYSTYLGDRGTFGRKIAVDSSGDAYLFGGTSSTTFPTTTGAFQTVYGGGVEDAFATELNPTGSALVYSTYLGGSHNENAGGIALDASGNAYLTGNTCSTNFPVTPGAFQTKGGGDCNTGSTYDAFVTELNPTGSALVYSTYLGGSGADWGFGISADVAGNAYVTGLTCSTSFPVTPGAFQTSYGGGDCNNDAFDAFVTELNPTGSALVYSTYLGGTNSDIGYSVLVDALGNAYVAGETRSTNFPVTQGAFQAQCDTNCTMFSDAFVTELNPAGSALVYSTYLGGNGVDQAFDIKLDATGNAYVVGFTNSTDFPTTPGAFQTVHNNADTFVTELNPTGSALVYSTYFGGFPLLGIAADGMGNFYITGSADSNFPTTPGAFQTVYGGNFDAFVTKFVAGDQVWPLRLDFGNQTVGTASTPQNTVLSNSGTTALSIQSIRITGTNSGDFAETDDCDTSLPAGHICTIKVTFTPPVTGNRNAAVIITDSAANSPQSVLLTGVGVLPAVTFSPPKLDFGNQTVGIPSHPQITVLNNTGLGILTITSISITGPNSSDFAEKDNCPASIPPKGRCKIRVTFTPSAEGTRSAAVSITDNAPGSPQQLPLSGVGVLPAVTFSPANLTFPRQLIFTTSQPKPVTLTNTGPGILLISKISVISSFSQTHDCPRRVAPGAQCTIQVKFHSRKKGVQHGSVRVTDNAPGSPQEVPLTGTGTYVQLLPRKVSFGTQPVGTRSLPKTITLTNKGDGPVNIQGISVTGLDAGDFAEKNNCGKRVASGASCFIKVTFRPSAKGKRSAEISVRDDGGGSPQKVSLTGTGT